jgi:preprotein translocase subunit SecE
MFKSFHKPNKIEILKTTLWIGLTMVLVSAFIFGADSIILKVYQNII